MFTPIKSRFRLQVPVEVVLSQTRTSYNRPFLPHWDGSSTLLALETEPKPAYKPTKSRFRLQVTVQLPLRGRKRSIELLRQFQTLEITFSSQRLTIQICSHAQAHTRLGSGTAQSPEITEYTVGRLSPTALAICATGTRSSRSFKMVASFSGSTLMRLPF